MQAELLNYQKRIRTLRPVEETVKLLERQLKPAEENAKATSERFLKDYIMQQP